MKTDEAPFRTLQTLVRQLASGELICASGEVEVHVYLQRGRVAWATDSAHPFAFTRHLQTTAGIDTEGFRDILESCKRERRPLGETLVSWGLVTQDEIRTALRHQLELALVQLRDGGAAQTLFLDRTRQFALYDEALTFGLDEILPSAAGNGPSDGLGRKTPPPAPTKDDPPLSARRLLASSDDLLWTELFHGTTRVESEPATERAARFSKTVLERTLLDGAALVIVWLPEGLLAGVVLGGTRSLWCRLAPGSTVGAAASALGAMAAPTASGSAPEGPRGASWVLGDQSTPALDEVRALVDRAPEIMAALLVDGEDPARSCGVGREPLLPETALSAIRQRAQVFSVNPIFDDGLPSDADANGVGFHFRCMVTAERAFWCFGAELTAFPSGTVWVLLDRACAQGLGWAYLTSLSRTFMRVGTAGCRG
jgi:hypothetical protein